MLKRSFNVLTVVNRIRLSSNIGIACYHRSLLSQQQTSTPASPRKEIKSLEDLADLNSLDGVDTELIRNLINERTTELNIKNELNMLRKFSAEEELGHESPMKKFVRPLWMFILMGSSVYLLLHYTWWKLEYDERENELKKEVEILECQLNELISQDKNRDSGRSNDDSESGNAKPWYKRLF
ncbi:hypothetical protein SKDZ_16G1740 [Saccharomyces kudriavzevii ZP591]|uniref:AIM43-like protein n=3 Tax=Saccharomyces TaxID=4930 RepID=J4TYC6_SACK1|nr:uncharacterized protein SKDI_16G1750 [Saccharomyces kudriavzevii IFO 1802]EHM99899.1 YPL099C-like protein [Saccharomyces cerevisiae x Saccharomyces kudriavzevii VIN7]EJT43105.1 AIM43-like protein [Saccharomyces kudriavzevii IFO 1802]CAI4053265.1 hypothetical protein SKDZ_16G1740 [Saccharomyces kudriavzevii ZP591]CAI4053270.1 hypothetical protein SKDI_16G1750 [Saccharomyces kudriavzevii IFO 1802]